MVTGTRNAWSTPILQTDGVEFVNMGSTNREMEFHQYLDFLVKIACFPADTLVTMADGTWKPIQDVAVGDMVLTHRGLVKKVTHTRKHRHVGRMVRTEAACGVKILSTPNHPFYVVPSAVRRDYYGRVLSRSYSAPGWKNAADLKVESANKRDRLTGGDSRVYSDDYLFAPAMHYPRKPWEVWVREAFGSKLGNIPPGKYEIGPDLAWLFGLWVAEGSCSQHESDVTFSLHEDETELIAAVRSILKDAFGLETRVDKFSDRHGVRVVAYSRPLAEELTAFFGKRSTCKRLSQAVFDAEPEIQRAFIKGLIDGDGFVTAPDGIARNLGLVTACKTLAEQVSVLALAAGFGPANVMEVKRTHGYSGTVESGGSGVFYRVVFGKGQIHLFSGLKGTKGEKVRAALEADLKPTRFSNQPVDGGYAIQPYRYEDAGEHDIWVYNLEVADDHSYLVNGCVAVHNCAVYSIDPGEINFYMQAGGQGGHAMFESGQEAKLKMSKDKGLRPLLSSVARWINQHILPLVSDEHKFTWVGVDSKDEKELVEIRAKEGGAYATVDEVRKDAGRTPIGEEKGGNLILNPHYITWLQQKSMAESMAQQGGGDEGEAPDNQGQTPGDDGESEDAPEGEEKEAVEGAGDEQGDDIEGDGGGSGGKTPGLEKSLRGVEQKYLRFILTD
jgi:hypothetical protein